MCLCAELDKQPETVAALKQNPALLLSPNTAPYPDTARMLGLRDAHGSLLQHAAGFGQRMRAEYGLDKEGADNHFVSVSSPPRPALPSDAQRCPHHTSAAL